MKTLDLIDRGADFSPDHAYRYRLWRRWGCGPMLAVIGLNPSTADETNNDPTVRRCIGYAQDWGYTGLMMVNLFAYRSTDPDAMKAHYYSLGTEARMSERYRNRDIIRRVTQAITREGGAVLAAWGTHGDFLDEGTLLTQLLALDQLPMACLGRTKQAHPKHPLYLPKGTRPVVFLGGGGRLVTQWKERAS